MKIGSIYKEIRKSKKLTQSQVCNNRLSRTTLSKFENNSLTPSIDTFSVMLNSLNMSYDEFLFIQNDYHHPIRDSIILQYFTLSDNSKKELLYKLLEDCSLFLLNVPNDKYLIFIKNSLIVLLELNESKEQYIEKQTKKLTDDLWTDLSNMDTWFLSEIMLVNALLFRFPLESSITIGLNLLHQLERFEEYKRIEPLRISIYLNIALLSLQNCDLNHAKMLCEMALTGARDLKRYDLILISKVRYSMSQKDFISANLHVSSFKIMEDHILNKELINEITSLKKLIMT